RTLTAQGERSEHADGALPVLLWPASAAAGAALPQAPQPRDEDGRLQNGTLMRPRVIVLSVASLLTISVAPLALIPVAIVTLFRARRLYAAVASHTARLVLRWVGVRVVVHQERAFPRTQTVYVSNHKSTLDLFVRVALAFPNTRFV